MTTLERPLPLNVVVSALILCCVGGFAMGLTNALKIDRGVDDLAAAMRRVARGEVDLARDLHADVGAAQAMAYGLPLGHVEGMAEGADQFCESELLHRSIVREECSRSWCTRRRSRN